jgi:hypothetical protein
VGGRDRGDRKSVCVCEWEGERERNRREVESVCESVRGREKKIERGVDRELNVGERGICRRDRGEIMGGRGEREGGGGRECVCEREKGGERNTKRRGRERV